jgi:hypothetical protein
MLPVTPLETAWIVVVPAAAAVAKPPAAMVAVAVLEDDQVATLVKSLVVLSLNVPVAVNCCVLPAWIEAPDGVTEMEVRVAGEFPGLGVLVPPHPAKTNATRTTVRHRTLSTFRS